MAGERLHVFLILRRDGRNERIVVWDTQDVSVGRAPENDVVVDDAEMSRQHARFRKEGANFLVDNLSTSNPTYVNDAPVTSQALQNKDVVRIAATELVFCRVTQNPVTLGIKTEFASQLKGFGPPVASGDGEATILGLMDAVGGDDDEFQVRPAGDFQHDMAGIESPPAPRNLDLELADDGLEDLDMPKGGAASQARGAEGAASTLSLTIELQGLGAEQQRFLLGLMGKVIELPRLRIRVKGGDLG
jgi:predicted component of type VI protein secretion system